ncbi:MAG: LptA/OstA family protein [Alphaproteobacteria bacterium]
MKSFIALISLFMLMLAPAAHAQLNFGGDADILIDAEKATYKGRTTILEGAVDVRQGNAQIFSDTMNIYRAEAVPNAEESVALGAVTRIEAEGNFKYITLESTVTGNRGVYERSAGIITVTGNVKVVQKSGNTASTDRLIYNVKTETIRFAGDCLGKQCQDRPSIRIK